MIINDFAVERLRDAAAALDASPVDTVPADVPAYDKDGVLHPLVDEYSDIGAPFTFHPFRLSVNLVDGAVLNFRLKPPRDRRVGTPILLPEKDDFHMYLPSVGYTALRGTIFDGHGQHGNPFVLFGENDEGLPESELFMPSLASASRIALVVAGIVQSKAVTVTQSANISPNPTVEA